MCHCCNTSDHIFQWYFNYLQTKNYSKTVILHCTGYVVLIFNGILWLPPPVPAYFAAFFIKIFVYVPVRASIVFSVLLVTYRFSSLPFLLFPPNSFWDVWFVIHHHLSSLTFLNHMMNFRSFPIFSDMSL